MQNWRKITGGSHNSCCLCVLSSGYFEEFRRWAIFTTNNLEPRILQEAFNAVIRRTFHFIILGVRREAPINLLTLLLGPDFTRVVNSNVDRFLVFQN